MKLIWLVVLAGMAMACAGRLETRALSAEAAANTHRRFDGIIYHPGQYVKLTYEYATRIDDSGKVVGYADSTTCIPVLQKEELQILPDYTRAYLLSFKPGVFNDGKFTVNLDRGMLASVNAETESQLASVVTAVASLAGALRASNAAAAAVRNPNANACNAGPRLRGMKVMRLEEQESGNASRAP